MNLTNTPISTCFTTHLTVVILSSIRQFDRVIFRSGVVFCLDDDFVKCCDSFYFAVMHWTTFEIIY